MERPGLAAGVTLAGLYGPPDFLWHIRPLRTAARFPPDGIKARNRGEAAQPPPAFHHAHSRRGPSPPGWGQLVPTSFLLHSSPCC
jgi:hypothetical protein